MFKCKNTILKLLIAFLVYYISFQIQDIRYIYNISIKVKNEDKICNSYTKTTKSIEKRRKSKGTILYGEIM